MKKVASTFSLPVTTVVRCCVLRVSIANSVDQDQTALGPTVCTQVKINLVFKPKIAADGNSRQHFRLTGSVRVDMNWLKWAIINIVKYLSDLDFI